MGRCTVLRWAFVAGLLCVGGCAMPRMFNPFGWKPDSDSAQSSSNSKTDKQNPFKKSASVASTDDSSKDVESDEKSSDSTAATDSKSAGKTSVKGSGSTKLSSLDPDLRKLVQEELQHEPAEDREKTLNQWLKFDPTLIRELVESQRAARQLAESREKRGSALAVADESKTSGGVRLVSGNAAGGTAAAGGALGTANPWGDSSETPISTTPRPTTAPLGNGSRAANPFEVDDDRGPTSRPIASASATSPAGSVAKTPPDLGGASQKPLGTAGMNGTGSLTATGDAFADLSADGGNPASALGDRSGSSVIGNSEGPKIQPGASASTSKSIGPGTSGSGSSNPPDSTQPVQLGGPTDVPSGATAFPATAAGPKSSGPAGSQPSGLAGLAGRLVGAITPGSNATATRTSQAQPANWHDELQKVVTLAASDAAQTSAGTTDAEKLAYTEKQVYLNMLYIISGQSARSMQPIPGLDPPDQEFWQQVFWSVSNYFDRSTIADPSNRATETITQLRAAIRHLQAKSKLELKNVVFCHKITNYGNYERFKRDEFTAGQHVLLYAEVENFKSEPTSEGPYRTILKSTIEIFDSRQNAVTSMPLPSTEDLCINPRRDYYNSYEFVIPEKIGLGPHTLKLTVEDQISQKIATYTVNFTVK